MHINQLIKKSVKQKTLLTDIFGYSLIKFGFADKYLAGQVTMYKSYTWLKRKYEKELENYHKTIGKNDLEKKEAKKIVWICWFQGMENAPQIVKDCYDSVCYWLNDWEIIVITEQNMNEYVRFPDYIIDKWKKGIITNTHLSDLLRIELLIQYGGLWLDSTTYMTNKIPNYILNSDFFVYRNGWMDMEMINMGSWLIYCQYTNNNLLKETQFLLYKYWEKNDFMKNYFIMHMFFRMVTDINKDEWNKVPMVNHIDSHLLMNELTNEYDEQKVDTILKLTSIHKLTYKFKLETGITAVKLSDLFKSRGIMDD